MDSEDARESELRWVTRAQAGEPQALDWLVRSHAALVQRMLRRVLGPRQDLEDLIQSTFVETLRALPSFRAESSIRTFIGAIAIRIARRAMRPEMVHRLRAPLPEEEQFRAEGALPDAQVEARMRLDRVRTALAHLSEKKRIAFLLWSLEGLSPEEIATLMEASLAATRSRIHYAQKELLAHAERDAELKEWLLERSHGRR